MELVVIGVSHHTAPVEVREKLAFSLNRITQSLSTLSAEREIDECMILSTCNRVEITAAVEDIEGGIVTLKQHLYDVHQLPYDCFADNLFVYQGGEALQHLFRVASSLDSMIIGEPQILGQLKDAFGQAQTVKTLGGFLHTVLHKAFHVAKKIRSETGIAQNAVSVSFAAVELAKKIFGEMTGKKVLVLGAGEMSELVLQHLVSAGSCEIFVANRTAERAEKLAAKFAGSTIPFPEIADHLEQFDIIISSTGSPDYVLYEKQVKQAMRSRHHRPIFLIDIAVPRDLDPKINDLEQVYLYDIDDLNSVVNANLKERQKESLVAEKIVEQEVEQFRKRLYTMEISPTITALRERFERVRIQELEKALGKLKNISEADCQIIDRLTSSITNKLLHDPVTQIKQKSASHDTFTYVEAVHTLFQLDENSKKSSH